ncbi:MAG: GEVED domain-containing protein [Tepidisphaeraceae bacterium]
MRRASRRHGTLSFRTRRAAFKQATEMLEQRRLMATDFGDAPDTYGTLIASSGVSHPISPNIVLGFKVDAELDGQPSPNAQRDDLTGTADDEDGIQFLSPITPGSSTNVKVTLSAGGGNLSGWIDFNQNGVFDNPTERIFTAVALPGASSTTISFTTPAGTPTGATFARFRLVALGAAANNPTGASTAFGEVEDYQVEVTPPTTADNLDWGDAPDSYQTTLAVNGPRHTVTPNLFLGGKIDAEPNGLPNPTATGDDTTGSGDEDGITFLTPMIPGGTAQVKVVTGAGAGRLNAWIDFNHNGLFEPAIETVFSNTALPGASSTVLTFTVPTWAVPSSSFSRWRLTFGASIAGPVGFDSFGEVEDHRAVISPVTDKSLDYGDAPNSYGTLLASNGARHFVTPNLRLGAKIDAELNGVPSLNADGDDLASTDDEDGITFIDPIAPGQLTKYQVVNGGGPGQLWAWLDFNANGVFDPATETIAGGINLPGASTTIQSFTSPATAVIGTSYARFRLIAIPTAAITLSPIGLASKGEVEDYRVKINEIQTQELDWGDLPQFAGAAGYPTKLALNGPRHALTAQMPRLGTRWDAETDGQPTVGANGDDLNVFDDEDGVRVGGMPLDASTFTPGVTTTLTVGNGGNVTGLLNAWADWNHNLAFDPGEQIATNTAIASLTTISLSVTPPTTLTPGLVYLRFRINTTGGLSPTGFASNGEVEDYGVKVNQVPTSTIDYSDAPNKTLFGTSFPTTIAENGAGHGTTAQMPTLGALRDTEANGQPNTSATGDDIVPTNADDEDAVFDPAGLPINNSFFYGGQLNKILVNVTGSVGGYLNAWIDNNQDNDWDDAGEHFIIDDTVTAGIHAYDVMPDKLSGKTTMRFRISTTAGLDYFGLAQDGEVEDYVVGVKALAGPTPIGWDTTKVGGQGVSVLFDGPIDPTSIDVDDLTLTDTSTGKQYNPKEISVDKAVDGIATYFFTGQLPDGNYRFSLNGDAVSDGEGNFNGTSLDSTGEEFFFLAGDANGDRTVNFADLLALAAHYGQPSGKDVGNGDFNYDGMTNFSDLLVLAAQYGKGVGSPAGALATGGVAIFSSTPIAKDDSVLNDSQASVL